MSYKHYFHVSIDRFKVSGATIEDQKRFFVMEGINPQLVAITGKNEALWSVGVYSVELDVAMAAVWDTMRYRGVHIERAGCKWVSNAIEIPSSAYRDAIGNHGKGRGTWHRLKEPRPRV